MSEGTSGRLVVLLLPSIPICRSSLALSREVGCESVRGRCASDRKAGGRLKRPPTGVTPLAEVFGGDSPEALRGARACSARAPPTRVGRGETWVAGTPLRHGEGIDGEPKVLWWGGLGGPHQTAKSYSPPEPTVGSSGAIAGRPFSHPLSVSQCFLGLSTRAGALLVTFLAPYRPRLAVYPPSRGFPRPGTWQGVQ